MHEGVSIETISLQNTKSAMAVYSREIIYNDRIATITISRQLQKKEDNCDRLLLRQSTMVLFKRSLFRLEAIASHDTNKRYITSVKRKLMGGHINHYSFLKNDKNKFTMPPLSFLVIYKRMVGLISLSLCLSLHPSQLF